MSWTTPFSAALPFGATSGGRDVQEVAADRLVPAEPDPGYVYLSTSKTMPGFVLVDAAEDDPRGLTWNLQTVTGVTRFKNVFAVRTSDCGFLAVRFREMVEFDQIPHHAGLFKMPLRFAKNILEVEARAFPSAEPMPPQDRRKLHAAVAGIAAALVVSVAALAIHQRPASKVAERPKPEPAATEAAPPAVKPHFRFSKMSAANVPARPMEQEP